MAHGKDPSRQSEREKSDETQRDSDSASEHQADFDRDAERVEADRAKLQSRSDSDASRDLGRADVARSGAKRQAEGDERLRLERQTSDQAIKGEPLEPMLLQKRDGALPPLIRPVFRRIIIAGTKRATKKPGRNSDYQGRIPRYCKP